MGSFKRSIRRNQSASSIDEVLAKLKHLIESEGDLNKIDRFFHERVGKHPGIRGDTAENPRFLSIVELVAQRMDPKGVFKPGLFTRVEKQGFWHGAFSTSRGVGLAYYFDEINRGLITHCDLGSTRGDYFRFSIPEELPADGKMGNTKLVSVTERPKGSPPTPN